MREGELNQEIHILQKRLKKLTPIVEPADI